MREIKFRARKSETGEVLNQLYDGQCFQWVNYERQSNIVIEQFTGLKDKNGKDIYEGDILSNGMVNPKIGVVNYRNCYFEIRAIKNFSCLWNDLSISNMSYKVIGNIYENQELLEK